MHVQFKLFVTRSGEVGVTSCLCLWVYMAGPVQNFGRVDRKEKGGNESETFPSVFGDRSSGRDRRGKTNRMIRRMRRWGSGSFTVYGGTCF